MRWQVDQPIHRDVVMGVRGNGEEAVVAFPRLALFLLLDLEHADQTRRRHATRGDALVKEQQHIEWIAILAARRREEAEVEWKGQALAERGAEPHHPAIAVV